MKIIKKVLLYAITFILTSCSSDQHIHNFNSEWFCDENQHWRECSCGEKGNYSFHMFGEPVVEKEATEYETGYGYEICRVCSYKNNLVFEKLPHTHKPSAPVAGDRVEPTCTQNGYYELLTYCSECDELINVERKEIDPTGHNSINYRVENLIEPTCTSEGSYDYVEYCETCGTTLSVTSITTNIKDHDYVFIEEVDATYEHDGYKIFECSACGDSFNVKTADQLIHHFSDTIEHDDYGHWHPCTDDGYEYLQADYELHDYKVSVLEQSTCYSNGLARYTCNCGYSYEGSLPLLEHQFGDWISNNDATCLEDGTKWHICSLCLYKETVIDEGSATGHSWTLTDSKAATCEEDGWELFTCDECGETKTENIPNYGGHNFVNGGCTKCGEFIYSDLFKLNVTLPCEFKYMAKYGANVYTKCVLEKTIYELNNKEDTLYLTFKLRKTYHQTLSNTTIGLKYKLFDKDNNEQLCSDSVLIHDVEEIGVVASCKVYLGIKFKMNFDGSVNYLLELSDYVF